MNREQRRKVSKKEKQENYESIMYWVNNLEKFMELSKEEQVEAINELRKEAEKWK